MQKGFVPILILLGVLVIAGLVGGAFYLGKSANLQKTAPGPVITPQTQTPSPKVSALPLQTLTPITDETTTWKTYTNSKIGFEIKYPPDIDIAGQLGLGLGPITENESKHVALGSGLLGPTKTGSQSSFEGQMSIAMTPFQGSVEDFVNSGQVPEFRIYSIPAVQKYGLTQKESINNIEMFFYDSLGDTPFYGHLVFFVGKGYAFELRLDDRVKKFQGTPLEILSTFKFTN